MIFFALCLILSGSILAARGIDAKRTRAINAENERLLTAAAIETDEANKTDEMQEIPTDAAAFVPPLPDTTTKPATEPVLLPAAERLLARNSDLVGWLHVECVDEINLAIVQRNNTYYLNHDFDQKKNGNGTAFLDEACGILPRDDNLTIYAHNMFDGTMFGKLNRMTSLERIREAPFTKFSTLYEQDLYVPIAVLHCSTNPYAVDYFAFSMNRFATEAAFEQHVAYAKALSPTALPFDARYGDKLLTLVTCIKNDADKRLVVVLRALRADETRDGLRALLNQTKG